MSNLFQKQLSQAEITHQLSSYSNQMPSTPTQSSINRSISYNYPCNYMSPKAQEFFQGGCQQPSPIKYRNGNTYSPSVITFPQHQQKQTPFPIESSATFNLLQNDQAKKNNGQHPQSKNAFSNSLYKNDQENVNPTKLFTQEFSNKNFKQTPQDNNFQYSTQPMKNSFINTTSDLTPPEFFYYLQKSPSIPYLTPHNENMIASLPVRDPYISSSIRQVSTKYTQNTQRLETLSARDELSEQSSYSDKPQPQTFTALAAAQSVNNRKSQTTDIPLQNLLENAINKAITNSQKLNESNIHSSARKNVSESNALRQGLSQQCSIRNSSKSVHHAISRSPLSRSPSDNNSLPQYLQNFKKQNTSFSSKNSAPISAVSEKIKNCMTPHKRCNKSSVATPSNKMHANNHQNSSKKFMSNNFNERESRDASRSLTPTKISVSQYIEREISNADVQKFLKKHFVVGEKLICDDWDSIPLIYFVKLVVSEFPEVLEDHQIGENLLAELKETIGNLVVSDEQPQFICLSKLQAYSKTTGLLGLVLHALKEISSEDRVVTHASIISNGYPQVTRSQTPSRLPSVSNSRLMDNITDAFQNPDMQCNGGIQQNDIQNIQNIVQEIMESLYKQMENEIYSKFDVEMRRLTVKLTQTEQMFRLVSDKVTNNYYLFQQESTLQKKLRASEEENKNLNEQLSQKDIEIQRLLLVVESLTSENQKLEQEGERLHQRLDKYMEFGMQNLQTLYENNLQDKYKLLVAQQTAFFSQLEQDRLKYRDEELEKLKKQVDTEYKSKGKEQSNTFQSQKSKESVNSDLSDGENCNIGGGLVTLQNEEQFESSSDLQKSKVREFKAKQKESVFRTNKAEGQMLEQMRESGESELYERSNKMVLIKAINILISHQLKPTISTAGRRIGAAEKDPNSLIFINQSTFLPQNNLGESIEHISEKLSCLVDIFPLYRDTRLITQNQLFNFLLYFYQLQMIIHLQSQNENPQALTKEQKITQLPINKCWKRILKEMNQGQLNLPLDNSSSQNHVFMKSDCLTPTSKPDILQMQKIGYEQSKLEGFQIRNLKYQEPSNNNNQNQLVLTNGAIIQNQTVVNILQEIFRQHLDRIQDINSQQGPKSNLQSGTQAKVSKLIILKALLQLNSILISTNKADTQSYLQRFLSDLTPFMSLAPVSSFIKDFDVIGVLFFALKTINFSNTKIVADSLQFLIAFKSIASNYMTFVRQVAQERNVTAIINLLEQHSDLQNISLALGILKNLTYSFNFKEITQSHIKSISEQMIQRYSSHKNIKELAESIKANVSCSVSIRTMPLSPTVSTNFMIPQINTYS